MTHLPIGQSFSEPRAPQGAPATAAGVSPRTVVASFWLYLVAALFQLIAIFGPLVGVGSSVAESTAPGATFPGGPVGALVVLTIILMVFVETLMAATLVLFAFFLKRGAGWARIVLTVLVGLSLLGLASSNLLGLLGIVIAAVATVFMWLTPSTVWFRTIKANKRAAGGV